MRRDLIFLLLLYLAVIFIGADKTLAEVSLENYCKDGFYQIPGEKKCSRAPKCGGKTYDDLNKAEFTPDHNDCLDEGRGMLIGDPPNSSAFYGYVPLCCYEMARLKDPEMCIGYWERLWCHPDQCVGINKGCGEGGCNCAHAMKGWCEIRACNLLPPVPIEVRLGIQKPAPSTPPQPTSPPKNPTLPPPVPTDNPSFPQPTIPPADSSSLPHSPTPAPFDIGSNQEPDNPTPVPIQPEQSPISEASFSISASFKSLLRMSVVTADKGFKSAGNLVFLVRQTDMRLEYYANLILGRLLKIAKNITGQSIVPSQPPLP